MSARRLTEYEEARGMAEVAELCRILPDPRPTPWLHIAIGVAILIALPFLRDLDLRIDRWIAALEAAPAAQTSADRR